MWGDLPVPPTLRFPTEIVGIENLIDLKYFLSYSQCRKSVIAAYIAEKGKSKYRKSKLMMVIFSGMLSS